MPRTFDSARAIAIEGGGVLGMAYLPIIRALEPYYVGQQSAYSRNPAGPVPWTSSLDKAQIRHFSGASAGAITAMMMALGVPASHIEAVITDTPWAEFAGGRRATVNLIRLIRTLGWHDISYPRQWIRDRVRDAISTPDYTFGQLASRWNRHLYVAATNEDRGTLTVFGPETHPDLPIADAVLASMAIPLYWPPIDIGGVRYSDGGLTCNHPCDVFPSAIDSDTVLGLRLMSSAEITGEARSTGGVVGRALRLITIARAAANAAHIPSKFWDAGRIIAVDTGELSSTDFDGAVRNAAELADRGAFALDSWIRQDEGSASTVERYVSGWRVSVSVPGIMLTEAQKTAIRNLAYDPAERV